MANLETLGYLSQPHISAGRVPTEKAYRYYVDRTVVVPAWLRPPRNTSRAPAGGRRRPGTNDVQRFAGSFRGVAQRGTGPGDGLEEKVLEYIKFVLLPDRRIWW